MATPPASPSTAVGSPRPFSSVIRPTRSSSRMSMSSKQGGGSRASDEESRTSVKVVVRVRPALKQTDPGFELIPQRFQRSMVHVTSPTTLAVDSPQGRKVFIFDRIFGPEIEQEGIWTYLNESVNAFVQGYNVSLLAYGQSGAGKSYTMGTAGPVGSGDTAHMAGVVPRAATAIFEKLGGGSSNRTSTTGLRTPKRYSTNSIQPFNGAAKLPEKNWIMKATYVEIYNEQLRDLLLPESLPPSERNQITIREDAKGRILPTGLHQVTINSVEDLLNALSFGSSIRQTDATAINAKSSRSHAVFSLNLIQKKNKGQGTPAQEKRFSVPLEAMTGNEGWVTVDSKLHFVDLAGSERLKNTGAQGDRAKEGISINAGLASLGKVISQLSSRQGGAHVSYRDSKLTRLLQDSLGGNAITYMIACVTPAEFHLSETLNTVQYAQRARAIQSKPQIQQVSDEADKQALIDRLRAEVQFLRDQIRNSERGDRRSHVSQYQGDRQNERQMELQNQLLDVQENYNALSQRHAKLISEMTKARDNGTIDITPETSIGESAVDRLNRSNSFAEAVEQVVLEYEKTIQSLENSLSSTRSSLANTESNLLEKETRCAYVETINQQLQLRLQKLMDRETSTESYLRDLETKLDGQTSGEEKNAAIISELRKEIARIRENEANCEDYISTLEERLAEADQDAELMHREISRLEHVIERQRSLGKLDNLLYELDHMQQSDKDSIAEHLSNGNVIEAAETAQKRKSSSTKEIGEESKADSPTSLRESPGEITPIEEEPKQIQEPLLDTPNDIDQVKVAARAVESTQTQTEPIAAQEEQEAPQEAQTAAQAEAVAEKLASVTQELFDLRVEHDSTVTDYDVLSAKYEEALRSLTELREEANATRKTNAESQTPSAPSTRSASFLGQRLDEPNSGEQSRSSRSPSSELSSPGDLPSIVEPSEFQTSPKESDNDEIAEVLEKERALALNMEHLKQMQSQKDENMAALTQQYAHLQEQHQDTLDVVEILKAEVQRAKLANESFPNPSIVRRKSGQNLGTVDRAHRSFASLRNLAAEQFERQPDVMQHFELNLNAAMHELYSRSERVQSLESELADMKREMETKTTIIAGLTRERSSLKSSSPIDISMAASLRDQLLQSENEIRVLREGHAAREEELLTQINSLNSLIAERANTDTPVLGNVPQLEESAPMPGLYPETPLGNLSESKELGETPSVISSNEGQKIASLEEELHQWEVKHRSAVDSMQASEKQLLATIAELEMAIKTSEQPAETTTMESLEKESPGEVPRHILEEANLVESLRTEIDGHKKAIDERNERISLLQDSQAEWQKRYEEKVALSDTTEADASLLRDLVSNLERQIEEQKSAVAFHQQGLKSLQETHASEIENVRSSMLIEAQASTEVKLAEQTDNYRERLDALELDLAASRGEMASLLENMSAIFKEDCSVDKMQERVRVLANDRDNLLAQHEKASLDLQEATNHGTKLQEKIEGYEKTVGELSALNDELVNEIARVSEKERKSSRLVEELEEQLASNFDQHQIASNRLSLLQNERNVQLEEAIIARAEAERELDAHKKKIVQLESRNSGTVPGHERTDSANSQLRKSTSVASLPSPPPAIPLPPLPTANAPAGAPPASAPSSRPASKDLLASQLAEDQETRIRTIEKHLFAEKQLTATLEEALMDLESQCNKVKADVETWKKKAWSYEDEIKTMQKERNTSRLSVQAVEEERQARMQAEAARAHLEERMNAINKKKKKGSLNCF
ncbi:kinesin-domain-containing protein [Xylona heveae TC161]|uniref:Kinesin-domain-containing protein n=1 Tax=Xylona heveae (strain CBS 132557 / TC161) TaxID=1328760 RepID=A0A164ZS01_XYLHT|nr:kinesin-domain-containing protein [Xylona heveae TC161]KZF19439.1 kinesin-domain-containing protein [Xylona heveae TC161]